MCLELIPYKCNIDIAHYTSLAPSFITWLKLHWQASGLPGNDPKSLAHLSVGSLSNSHWQYHSKLHKKDMKLHCTAGFQVSSASVLQLESSFWREHFKAFTVFLVFLCLLLAFLHIIVWLTCKPKSALQSSHPGWVHLDLQCLFRKTTHEDTYRICNNNPCVLAEVNALFLLFDWIEEF